MGGSSFQVSYQARMSALNLADRAVSVELDLATGELGEPARIKVKPARASWGEMQHEPRLSEQPSVDRRRLVVA